LKPDNNQELAKLIGKRLREACEADASVAYPPEMTAGLAKIRQSETRSAAPCIDICTSSNGDAHTLDGTSTGTEAVHLSNEPIDVNV
jgi:hypothetical protein